MALTAVDLERAADEVRHQWLSSTKNILFNEFVDTPAEICTHLQQTALRSLPVLSESLAIERSDTIILSSEINQQLASGVPEIKINGNVVFDEDVPIRIGQGDALLDLRGAVLLKSFGTAPIIELAAPGCRILGGSFVQTGERVTYFSSPAILVNAADRCLIAGVTFLIHQGSAVLVRSATGTNLVGNRVVRFDPHQPSRHVDLGHDFLLWGSCRQTVVAANDLGSGRGVGILFQIGIRDAVTATENIVVANRVKGYREYGICLYSKRPPGEVNSAWNVICANEVTDVSGDVTNDNAQGRIYGSGIYVQGVQETVICFNHVSKVCQDSTSYMLGPAAVSAVNTSSACIFKNEVRGSGWYGAYLKDTSRWNGEGRSSILSNHFADCAKGGIRTACIEDVRIADNTFQLPAGVKDVTVHETCLPEVAPNADVAE